MNLLANANVKDTVAGNGNGNGGGGGGSVTTPSYASLAAMASFSSPGPGPTLFNRKESRFQFAHSQDPVKKNSDSVPN